MEGTELTPGLIKEFGLIAKQLKESMDKMVVRTIEQDNEHLLTVATYAIEQVVTPVKEASYKLSDPEVQKKFPNMSPSTLQKWCKKNGKTKGLDGCYRIKLSEIERSYNQENGSNKKTRSKRGN